ncbi:MAG: hypothetical protein JW726_09850 [Anaerolineales bacterium]|nr:hypothetical protein [Anaerolineales bacterium]
MRSTKRFSLSIQHLWSLTALVGVFVFTSTHPIRPDDFWWHLAIGREIVTSGGIPTQDIYSYTMQGTPYPSYQMFWLAEVAFYLVYRLGGPALIVFMQSLVITGAYGLLIWVSYRRSGSWRVAAFGGLFAAALGMFDWNVRPQAITFLIGALYLWAIERWQRYRQWGYLAVFPIGMMVWANSHGTFPLGLLLIGLWLVQETWDWLAAGIFLPRRRIGKPGAGLRAAIMALVLALFACLVNPRGIGIIDYVRTLTGNSAVQSLVTEWAPPSFNSLGGTLFFIALLLGAAILVLSPRRPKAGDLLAYLILGGLALKTSRGITWFGLLLAPVLAEHLAVLLRRCGISEQVEETTTGSKSLNRLFAGLLLLLAVGSLPWFKAALPLPEAKAGIISSETPIEAMQFLLDEKLPGAVFHASSFGSYMIWAAYPEYQVFIDPRIELYPLEQWQTYLAVNSVQPGWEDELAQYDVQTLFLSPSEQVMLIAAASASPAWEMVYQDSAAVIFTHRSFPFAIWGSR